MEETPVEAVRPLIDLEAEREARKLALREKLRNGRNSTASGTSEIDGGDEPRTIGTDGSSFEEAGRAITNIASGRRRSKNREPRRNDSSGGADRRAVGRGRASRRFGEDSGGIDASGSTGSGQRGIGRIETDDPDPIRLNPDSPAGEFYREDPAPKQATKKPAKRGKSIKEHIADSAPVKALKGSKKASLTLTDAEMEEFQETLTAALEDDFGAFDKYLWGRQKLYTPDDAEDDEVWSNMTEKEIGTLVKVMLKGAQHSPAMATVVRGVVDSHDYIALAAILFPRVKTTVRVMRSTHRAPQKRVQQAHSGRVQ